MLSLDNTENAFAYKTTQELKKAKFLFRSMGNQALLKLGLKLTPGAIKNHFPFARKIIRATIFKQFVGGEAMEETTGIAQKLKQFGVDVILDYGVEGGSQTESAYDAAMLQFIKVIDYAATQANIPAMSIKVTGLVSFALLEKLDAAMATNQGSLMKRYETAIDNLDDIDRKNWELCVARLEKICAQGVTKNVQVWIDAEETWIQDPVDAVTMKLMAQHNQSKPLIFNTVQMYRWDRYSFLEKSLAAAKERNFYLGIKIVRGAYMEKERERAALLHYPSPIQPNKAATDADYNKAISLCISNNSFCAVVVATHNEESCIQATAAMQKNGLTNNNNFVSFSQLFGMSDNITFNLAKAGYNASKYLPFGPIDDVIPYLMRRAQENSSVKGQTGRELQLIDRELKRRKAL